jgi:hypothetical protein
MYINFPRYNISLVRALFPTTYITTQFKSASEIESFISSDLLQSIRPLIEVEYSFLEQISDILRKVVSGEALSDS